MTAMPMTESRVRDHNRHGLRSWRRISQRLAALATGVTLALASAPAIASAFAIPATFEVSESGAARYSIPIAVPPGTAGMAPALALEYSSQGGNGLAGVGWSLSGLPAIGRCPQTVAQDGARGAVTFTAEDRYCLDGQRLVLVSGSYGGNGAEYRTERDGFSKIVSYGAAGSGPAWWKVWTKAGQILEFGNTADSRLPVVDEAEARAWAVNRITDTVGNYLTVTYDSDAQSGESRPAEIKYGGNDAAGVAPYNRVEFAYEAADRPDIITAYVAGTPVRISKRLSSIKAYTDTTLVRDHRLAYAVSPATQRSRLVSVTLCAGDGSCLPATNLSQGDGGNNLSIVNNVAGLDGYYAPTVEYRDRWTPHNADFNGDGKADILWVRWYCANNIYGYCSLVVNRRLWLSNGPSYSVIDNLAGQDFGAFDSRFTFYSNLTPLIADYDGDGKLDILWEMLDGYGRATGWRQLWWGQGNGSFTVDPNVGQYGSYAAWIPRVGDFNADGRADIFWTSADEYGRSTGYRHLWLGQGTRAFTVNANVASADGTLQSWKPYLADFNGDGRSDVLWSLTDGDGRSLGQRTLWLSNGSDAFQTINNVANKDNSYQYWTPHTGDFNGDGLADILWDHTNYDQGSLGQRHLWIGHGDGAFDIHENLAGKDGSYIAHRPLLADFNGDGKTDILWNRTDAGYGYRTQWFSRGDGNFTVADNVAGQNGYYLSWTPGIGDFNGDGKADIHWNLANYAQNKIWQSDGKPADVVATATNGLGASVTFDYKFLTDAGVYTKDGDGVYPVLDVQAPLPVVATLSASTGIAGGQGGPGFSDRSYTYAGLKLHMEGRGLLGFREVTATDATSGIEAVTTYRQDFPFTGMVTRSLRRLNQQELNRKDTTYDAVTSWGPQNSARYFVHASQSVERSWELDGTAMPVTTTDFAYDQFGNATDITVTTPEGAGAHVKATVNTYADADTVNWILGRLTLAKVTSTLPDGASETRISGFEYNGTTGLLTKETVAPGPHDPPDPTLALATEYGYDAFGNKVAVSVSGTDGSGTRTSTTTYDARGRFPETRANALGHTETLQHDPRFGGVTQLTGPNGLKTTWEYDGFGRKTAEHQFNADQSAEWNTRTWTYTLGAYVQPIGYTYTVTAAATGKPTVTATYDSLGREIRSETVGFDGALIGKDSEYDSWGRVARISRPYFASGGTPLWTVFGYDALGRAVSQTDPDGAVTTTTHAGLTTTVTNPLGQTRTTVKNAQGQVVSVTDAVAGTTAFAYDPFGNLTTTTDAAGHLTTAAFDIRGRKTAMTDPDMGSWTYAYNAFGELVSQIDAKGQATTMTYDALGRMTGRVEGNTVTEWAYDGTAYGVGKLWRATVTKDGLQSHLRVQWYNNWGLPSRTRLTTGAEPLRDIVTTYYVGGRVATVTYPSLLKVKYTYNVYGYLAALRNHATNALYWQPNQRDAELRLIRQTHGNGVVTMQGFDAPSGRLASIAAGDGDGVLDLSYSWDVLGNLATRSDARSGLQETFDYDALNRLTEATAVSPALPSVTDTVAYDAIGNITHRSDVGTYTYDTQRPHAVATVAGAVNASYTYDANGNMLAGDGRTVTYTRFNMPATVTKGATTLTFAYDADRQRVKQERSDGTTTTALYYYRDAASGALAERDGGQWKDYLVVGGAMIGMIAGHDTATPATRYFHKDHLGSIAAITDETTAVVERLSYDPWGKRRNPDGTAYTGGTSHQTTRGFTGHEHLDDVDLVHMNGRVYDAKIGRFLTADPFIQDAYDTQSLNRYSYVGNNPLAYTDPSGYIRWKKLWRKIRPIVAIAVAYFTGYYDFGSVGASSFGIIGTSSVTVANAAVAGFAGGLVGGGTLESAVKGSIFAMATFGIGGIESGLGRLAAHAAVGCASSAMGGGSCGSGALSAGFAHVAGPILGDWGHVGNYVRQAVIGGTASAIGGGKFENGAVTAAFAYMFRGGAAFPERTGGDAGALNRVLDVVGRIWTLPNTIVGLAYGGVGMMFGATPEWDSEAGIMRFKDMPSWLMPSAMSLGHAQVYASGRYKNADGTFGLNYPYRIPVVFEENLHTRQSEILGPLYLPLHGFSMLGSMLSGGGTHNNNPLEIGPMRGRGPWPWN